ncbi:uncharacterized protein LOC136041370 [Artemia franciscana]|uniref:uncharacterized protein LOC136041370 n=1 Tax=Artemia franciscana TaxID=6661 RepID=UPI0032DBA028
MDEATRKRAVNDALNRVLTITPINTSAEFKTATLSLIRHCNPERTDLGLLKSVKDIASPRSPPETPGSEITSKKHYELYVFQRIAASRKLLKKCAEEAKKCSASETIGNSGDEEEDSKTNKRQYMDEATRKRAVKDALNRVLTISPINASAEFKTATLSLIRYYNPDLTDLGLLKSV